MLNVATPFGQKILCKWRHKPFFMCGIIGYIGKDQAFPFLVRGLKKLEYKGYDSAGIALVNKNELLIYKQKGRVSSLVQDTRNKTTKGNIGIGHIRSATHGKPSDENAHPHSDAEGELAIVHNGSIENYVSLKKELTQKGYQCISNTDTELLVHLIKHIWKNYGVSLEVAVGMAMDRIIGSYAIAVASKNDNNRLIVAKKGKPLLIGLKENDFFIASDALPLVQYTNNVVILEDGEIGVLSLNEGFRITNLKEENLPIKIQRLEINLETIDNGAYDHFMLKEIFEQPKVIARTLKNRLESYSNKIQLEELSLIENKIQRAKRIVFTAEKGAWYSTLSINCMFESLIDIPIEVKYAPNFKDQNFQFFRDDIVIGVSPSGENEDVLNILEEAKFSGATTIAIVNTERSTLACMSDAYLGTKIGVERGIVSSKTFTTHLTVFALLAMHIGKTRKILSYGRLSRFSSELADIPKKTSQVLRSVIQVEEVAKQIKESKKALFLGSGINFCAALEGASKLKSMTRIEAQAYPVTELKCGPIASIDFNSFVLIMIRREDNFDKILHNILEIKAKGAYVMVVSSSRIKELRLVADCVIEVPMTTEIFEPMLNIIPLQLLSYFIADLHGYAIDEPQKMLRDVRRAS